MLTAVREEAVGGQYTLVLEFQVCKICFGMLRTHSLSMSGLRLLCRATGMPAASATRKNYIREPCLQYRLNEYREYA